MKLLNEEFHDSCVRLLAADLKEAVFFGRAPFDVMTSQHTGVRFYDVKTCSAKPLTKYGRKNTVCTIYLTKPSRYLLLSIHLAIIISVASIITVVGSNIDCKC